MQRLPQVFLIFSFFFPLVLPAKEVPRSLSYCGMELRLTENAQQRIQGYVDDILRSPRYFNEMVKRAHTYMPFIEEAFMEVGIPDDLKYLAIQESALRPDVVSQSQAVGFWQFKVETARDFGLRINDRVDERMHIYRASQAAAKYLHQANQNFDNWAYAVLAYYAGFTGAIEHTDPQYYGAKVMRVEEDLHWYVLKALAHKLAYEDAVGLRQRPLVSLQPFSNEGESQVKRLIEAHNAEEESFFLYNKWIRDEKRLPKGELFTYYVPQPAEFYTGHIEDPTKLAMEEGSSRPGLARITEGDLVGSLSGLGERESQVPRPASPEPERPMERPAQPIASMVGAFRAMEPDQMPRDQYVIFELIHDLHYGEEFVVYDGNVRLPELAEQHQLRLSQLMVWNNLLPGEIPPQGTLLYLDRPNKAAFHVVELGESLETIANQHRLSTRKLMRKNRIDPDAPSIYIGQKLYLKKKRPRGEKVIILRHGVRPEAIVNRPKPEPRNLNQASNSPSPSVEEVETTPTPPSVAPPVTPPAATKWVMHQVQPGESLWQIAQRYGTQVAIIKRSNDLTSDQIQVGQVLKVFSRAPGN